MTTTDVRPSAIEALAGRIFSTGVGAAELCTAYLGIHLGFYRSLADSPATPTALAERTGGDERYVREWLTAQAVAGLLTVAGPEPASAEFALADGTYEVLVDETSPAYLGGLADIVAAAGRGLPQLPDVLARLQEQADPAHVADLACGTGWAAIELAKAFPHITVDGLDNDEASVAIGRQHAASHGVADRVDLEVADLADESADWSPRYDLVLLIECVHDLPRPVEALRHARAAVRPGGTVLVVDERAAESFTAPGDEIERFFGAASAIWCLPQGRVGPDPEPVGTLIRPAAMLDLARRAGYADGQILPIEHPVWRFYRLVP